MTTNDLDPIVASARQAFAKAHTPAELENAKAQFVGKAGRITELMKGMASLAVDEKKTRGAAINAAKQAIEAALNERRQALAEGVPASRMLVVTRSTSTREDALYTRELMSQEGLRSAVLVTSPYHERRASLTFAKAFEGSGISVASYPVQDDRWQPDSWWRSSDTISLTLVELAKLAYYKLVGYI